MKNITIFLLLGVGIFSFSFIPSSFAEFEVNDRKIIDATTTVTSDSSTLGLLAGDRFGYQIEPIGDLDGDGVIDLAVSSYRDSNPGQHDDEGSVIVMFMNSDGTVKEINKILHDNTSDGLGTSCIDSSANVDPDVSGFEAIAYLGNLINDNPTIALGAPWDNYANTVNTSIHNTGAVYLLELETTGKVKSCVRIVDNDGSLFNPSSPRTTGDGAQFGFSLASTDLDGDGTLELLTVIQNTSIHDDLWAFYLDNTGAITTATEYTSSNLGINSYVDSMSSVNGGNKIAIGKESTGVYIVKFVGNTGVLSSVNLITDSSVGSSGSGFGSGVEPIGDLDGDGVIDLMVGALFTNDNGDGGGDDEGAVYILFMNSDDTVRDYQKISNTSEKTRIGSIFLQSNDFFGNDIAFWMNSNGETVVAIGAHDADTGASTAGELYLFYLNYVSYSSNDSCGDCSPPTFGLNRNNLMLVNNGFTYNGNSTDVTDYHTLFPLITVVTNQTNTVIVKVYENRGINNISNVQFGMGVPKVGSPLNDAQTLIEVWLDDGMIEKIVSLDENNLVTITNATTDIVPCGYTSSDCLQVTVDYIYRDQPKYNVMAINSMDSSRNSQTNYMNDGVLVIGQSMNAPLTQDVTVSKGGMLYPQRSGTVELFLADYKNDLWQDPFGYMWSTNQYGPYLVDDIALPIKEPDPIWQVMDRSNSHFSEMVEYEQARAVIHYDASKSKSIPDATVKYDYPERINEGERRKQILESEAARAEVMKSYLESTGYAPLVKEPNMMSGYDVRENEREFQLQSMPAKPYAEVKMLSGMMYVSGFAGYFEYDKPVIITKIHGDVETMIPIRVHNDGLFYIAVLEGFYDEMTVTHNGYELYHHWN